VARDVGALNPEADFVGRVAQVGRNGRVGADRSCVGPAQSSGQVVPTLLSVGWPPEPQLR